MDNRTVRVRIAAISFVVFLIADNWRSILKFFAPQFYAGLIQEPIARGRAVRSSIDQWLRGSYLVSKTNSMKVCLRTISALWLSVFVTNGQENADQALLKIIPTTAEVQFIIKERDLIPEGIAYDPATGSYFVGSLYKRKIVRIERDGKVRDFIAEGQDGLGSVAGMKVDGQRRILWGAHVGPIYIPGKGVADSKTWRGGLFKYDLNNGRLIRQYSGDSNLDGKIGFNDLALATNGEVFATATNEGAVYRLDPLLDSLSLYIKGSDFVGANGICLSPDEHTAFVATDNGIIRIDVATGQHRFLSKPDSIETEGIDGLYFYRNSLVGIQNGIKPTPIYRFFLNLDFSAITRRELVVQNPVELKSPTTGVIVGEWFSYIANSQIRSFTPEGLILPPNRLQNVLILKTRLHR